MGLTSSNPIETLAASLHAACLRDLPEIHYQQIAQAARHSHLDSMDQEARAEFLRLEQQDEKTRLLFAFDNTRRPTPNDCEVIAMFPQMWGSTALGFGGIGGAAMTSAYTTVIDCRSAEACAVYFGGRFAYLVPHKLEDGNENAVGLGQLSIDIASKRLASVAEHHQYTKPLQVSSKKKP